MTEASELPAEPPCPGLPLADWLEALSRDSPFGHPQAAAVWGGAPPLTAAVRRLFPLLRDPDRDVRLRAVAALADVGGQAHEILPALRAVLKEAALWDDDESVRTQAVRAVLQVGPQPASMVPALSDALQDELD